MTGVQTCALPIWLSLTKPPRLPARLDTLQAALRLYDALGPAPQLALLEDIRQAYDGLNQQEAKRAFFQRRLALYQARGPVEGHMLP